jgi:hypothetical protein
MSWLVRTGKDLGGRPPLASRCISLSWLFFHGGNTGSNPVGDANLFLELQSLPLAVRVLAVTNVGREAYLLRGDHPKAGQQ